MAAAITDERARRQSGTTRDQSGQTESSELLTAPQQKEDDGRKKAEQRRPSEIKGARIKGLSAFFFSPRLTGQRGGEQRGASVNTQWQRQLHAEAAEDIFNEQRQPVAAPLRHLSSTHARCIPHVTRTVRAHLAQHHLFIYSMQLSSNDVLELQHIKPTL